jgi:hypothetical protein
MNDYEDYIPDALEMVTAWEIPEEDFSRVVKDQARLMAGLHLEPSEDFHQYDLPLASLRF